jgi:putative transposase
LAAASSRTSHHDRSGVADDERRTRRRSRFAPTRAARFAVFRNDESVSSMRYSRHTDTEILYLLHEADAGIPIPEICRTAHISERTFYRWRKRYGSLTPPALLAMKELQSENRRLRTLLNRLSDRADQRGGKASSPPRGPLRSDCGFAPQTSQANAPAPTLGASVGRFAFVRGAR